MAESGRAFLRDLTSALSSIVFFSSLWHTIRDAVNIADLAMAAPTTPRGLARSVMRTVSVMAEAAYTLIKALVSPIPSRVATKRARYAWIIDVAVRMANGIAPLA